MEQEFQTNQTTITQPLPCYYRVSAKFIIKNHQNEILMVYETGSWDLPGGGIEFGEAIEQTIRRELLEELAIDVNNYEFSCQFLDFATFFKPKKNIWVMNLIYELNFSEMPDFKVGQDSDDVKFFQQQELQQLENPGAKMAYQYAYELDLFKGDGGDD